MILQRLGNIIILSVQYITTGDSLSQPHLPGEINGKPTLDTGLEKDPALNIPESQNHPNIKHSDYMWGKSSLVRSDVQVITQSQLLPCIG